MKENNICRFTRMRRSQKRSRRKSRRRSQKRSQKRSRKRSRIRSRKNQLLSSKKVQFEKDLKVMEELIKKQKKYLPDGLQELKTYKHKIGHWCWWLFPTDKFGVSEPGIKTYLTEQTLPVYLENYPKIWRDVLQEIYKLIVIDQKKLRDIIPKIDIGRSKFFVDFFMKYISGNIKYDWLQTILNSMIGVRQTVVLMMGYPGSGKTSYIKNKKSWNKKKWVILHGDELKTQNKIKKELIKALIEKKSVVIDATHPDKKKRKIFIDIARSYGAKAKLVHINTDFQTSMDQNNQRVRSKVPPIALYRYRKYFEKPEYNEGFSDIKIIN